MTKVAQIIAETLRRGGIGLAARELSLSCLFRGTGSDRSFVQPCEPVARPVQHFAAQRQPNANQAVFRLRSMKSRREVAKN